MFAVSSMTLEGQIIPAGAGSYYQGLPPACKALSTEISKTSSIKGPMPTNQWWSSLVWETYSQNLFPHPLGAVCHKGGLGISYPGSGLTGAGGHIIGSGVSQKGDFVIAHSAVDSFPSARLENYSDWFITTEFRNGDASLLLSFGHGSPFVYGRLSGGNPKLIFANPIEIWNRSQGANVLGITVRGNHYGVYCSTGSSWISNDAHSLNNVSSKGYFSIALLPDSKPSTLARFAVVAHRHVVNTSHSFKVVNGQLETTYNIETRAMEREGSETLFALYRSIS